MKKVMILMAAMILLTACAMQSVQTQAKIYPATISFDEVWGACLKAATTSGYQITNVEKESGLIMMTKQRNFLTQNENPQMNVFITQIDGGGWNVDATYIQPGQLTDFWGKGKAEADKYLSAVHKILI